MPDELLIERRDEAERKLRYASSFPRMSSPTADHLYQWAEDVIRTLTSRGDPIPKLTLAEALDIPTDPRWHGYAPPQRPAPKHRIIARFAREQLWEQVWSLNWDCAQESAFESVGIKRGDGTDDDDMPWPTVFYTFVTADECAHMAVSNTVKVVKPHGCVKKLIEAQDALRRGDSDRARECANRFLITQTELVNIVQPSAADDFIFATMCSKFSSHPLIVAGWSISEERILEYVEAIVKPTLECRAPLPEDELSIVDQNFNAEGHARLAACYNKTEAEAHIPVDENAFTINELLLWIQALYGVQWLDKWASDADKPILEQITTELEQHPDQPHFAIDWIDNFLPVWVRLCWRCGLLQAYKNGQTISNDMISLERRDEHIPWNYAGPDRKDLRAASRVLAALRHSQRSTPWDSRKYPGGLYRDNRLIITLPAWTERLPNSLVGLSALINAIKELGAGFIETINIIPVGVDPAATVPDSTVRSLAAMVARELAMLPFVSSDEITAFRLEDL